MRRVRSCTHRVSDSVLAQENQLRGDRLPAGKPCVILRLPSARHQSRNGAVRKDMQSVGGEIASDLADLRVDRADIAADTTDTVDGREEMPADRREKRIGRADFVADRRDFASD